MAEGGRWRQPSGMLIGINLVELRGSHDPGLSLSGVIGLEQRESFLVDPGQFGADGAFRHGAGERVFGSLHGVRGAIVAIDTVHHAALALRNIAFEARRSKRGLPPLAIAALSPRNGRV